MRPGHIPTSHQLWRSVVGAHHYTQQTILFIVKYIFTLAYIELYRFLTRILKIIYINIRIYIFCPDIKMEFTPAIKRQFSFPLRTFINANRILHMRKYILKRTYTFHCENFISITLKYDYKQFYASVISIIYATSSYL